MSITIDRIKAQNLKRFKNFEASFNEKVNILVGDNESGKSTSLGAIDLVLSGSRNKVEGIGLDNLFNIDVINTFQSGRRRYEDLPVLYIELYLKNADIERLEGRNNSCGVLATGLKLVCQPREDYSEEIKDILNSAGSSFPFEYYTISFKTFSDASYSPYKRVIKHFLLDNTLINNEYATRDYINTLYQSNTTNSERSKHGNEYRNYKESFKQNVFNDLNSSISDYDFSIKNNLRSNLESDITIEEAGVKIENKGKGMQCFIKAEFALKNRGDLNVILLEEPENHLSHTNTQKLINKISESQEKQIFIATHSSLIAGRLDLRNLTILNSNSIIPTFLSDLEEDTADFFIKAPNHNILELVLSKKVILVEGDAEYMLMEKFYNIVTGDSLLDSGIHIISVGGISFKRYIMLSSLLGIKTAVITDNDGDHQGKCIDYYSEYSSHSDIKVFFEANDALETFENTIYEKNTTLCDTLFSPGRRSLTPLEYMLKNKTDVAYILLKQDDCDVVVPDYIIEAIEWINN